MRVIPEVPGAWVGFSEVETCRPRSGVSSGGGAGPCGREKCECDGMLGCDIKWAVTLQGQMMPQGCHDIASVPWPHRCICGGPGGC